MAGTRRVCVAQITGAHGVRGLVKLKSFTEDPAAVAAYGPVSTEDGGRSFRLHLLSPQRDLWISQVEGVADRDAAEALAGTRLYVDRDRLPALEDEEEFYQADLVGLAAVTEDGEKLGEVVGLHNFGAGDVIEISGAAGSFMLPFTKAVIPVVDVAGGRIVVSEPEEAA